MNFNKLNNKKKERIKNFHCYGLKPIFIVLKKQLLQNKNTCEKKNNSLFKYKVLYYHIFSKNIKL